MTKSLPYYFLLPLIFFFDYVHSQYLDPRVNELNAKVKNELTSQELKKVQSSEKQMITAASLMEEANKMSLDIEKLLVQASSSKSYESKANKIKEKCIERLIKASGLYEVAYNVILSIYKPKLRKIRPKNDPKRIEVGKLLEKEASEHFVTAAMIRTKNNREKNYNKILLNIQEVQSLENLGMSKLINAFGIYLNWPEVIKDFKENLTEDVPDKIDSTINTAIVDKNPKIVNDLNKKDSLLVNNKQTIKKTEIIFKIQILAVRKEADELRVRSIYSGNEKVTENIENGWYKYTIGNFQTYAEAIAYKNKLNLLGSFVVAYQGGFRVDISSVIK